MQTGFVLNSAKQPRIGGEREQYLLMAYPRFAATAQVTHLGRPLLQTTETAFHTLPIEIAVFEATQQMEDTIIRWMHRIISNRAAFTIQVNQQIDATGKLMLRIADTTPFQQLASQLGVVSQYISSYHCPDMYFSMRPYLRPSQPSFDAQLTITELVLMRKRYEAADYRQVNVFGLKP